MSNLDEENEISSGNGILTIENYDMNFGIISLKNNYILNEYVSEKSFGIGSSKVLVIEELQKPDIKNYIKELPKIDNNLKSILEETLNNESTIYGKLFVEIWG